MSRYDPIDFEWRMIEPLLPNKPQGVPRVDDRRVLSGIFWVLPSGVPWRDLPERHGPRTIVLAVKAYDADRIRELIQNQGANPTSRRGGTDVGSLASASASTASAT